MISNGNGLQVDLNIDISNSIKSLYIQVWPISNQSNDNNNKKFTIDVRIRDEVPTDENTKEIKTLIIED